MMPRYWRVRLKNDDGDFALKAWNRSEVGIWYGAWSAEDYRNINNQGLSNQQIADKLNEVPAQQALAAVGGWDGGIPDSYASTARRFFDNISEGDWAVIYLEAEQVIALAQMTGSVNSTGDHPLNNKAGEVFKYRQVYNKKKFAIAQLPDAYRLVPTQGRGNIHEFSSMYEHVKLLAEHSTADQIIRELSKLPFDQQIDLMGASAWESYCVAWLIMEWNFIPTGLSTGRTLKAIDILGRNKVNGKRIIAQCKKEPNPVAIETDFVSSVSADDEAFYFAYGGCTEKGSDTGIRVIDGKYARKWAEETENGQLFQRLFLGGAS